MSSEAMDVDTAPPPPEPAAAVAAAPAASNQVPPTADPATTATPTALTAAPPNAPPASTAADAAAAAAAAPILAAPASQPPPTTAATTAPAAAVAAAVSPRPTDGARSPSTAASAAAAAPVAAAPPAAAAATPASAATTASAAQPSAKTEGDAGKSASAEASGAVKEEPGVHSCLWYQCTFTGPSAAFSQHLQEHVAPTSPRRCHWVGCGNRDFAFTDPTVYQDHILRHAQPNEKNTVCRHPDCRKLFRTRETMQRHFNTQHGATPNPASAGPGLATAASAPATAGPAAAAAAAGIAGGPADHPVGAPSGRRSLANSAARRVLVEVPSPTAGAPGAALPSAGAPGPNTAMGKYHRRYESLKLQVRRLRAENAGLLAEYHAHRQRLHRLRAERNVILDALLEAQQQRLRAGLPGIVGADDERLRATPAPSGAATSAAAAATPAAASPVATPVVVHLTKSGKVDGRRKRQAVAQPS
ncbi:hypothetical protein CXG81DRAFT_19976 [Caulochytrium protostelioides]|uniref:C2H2-type domain-containing protein n=1 Tax=Caulochytrium protostelioides TaxID=1555241 RepID=A0A4P9X4N5_9FUNG|nr:hypothetical protein CXG81DRAFT_19976 [Caulochytrium protostelioides]|eukprot:RKP00012.1 hypothetical protein CXG81DRAFT_19976 [Caulochytrium protostelioides]